MHIQIVLNILCQYFAIITINNYMNFMSIGFLIGRLLVIDDEKLISRVRTISQGLCVFKSYLILCVSILHTHWQQLPLTST